MAREAKRQDKNRYLSFMIVPHHGGTPIINLRVRYQVIYALASFLGLVALLTIGFFFYTTVVTRHLINYQTVIQENAEQKKELNSFSNQASTLRRGIQDLLTRDNEIRKVLGLKPRLGKSALPEKTTAKTVGLFEVNVARTQISFQNIKAELGQRKDSYRQLLAEAREISERYRVTPSIWPVYGELNSGFGWRFYPWPSYHTGADIDTYYGAPIRAAADGVVSGTGWRRGYGLTIGVDHGYGITTMYAHNSRLAVPLRARVKKGQIIAYAGQTGYSTGVHCHYEVIKYGQKINPVPYLGLDIFTASRLWHSG